MRPHSPATRRKFLFIPVIAAVFASSLVSVSTAQAAGEIPLNIVGTSDVSDSDLMTNVITPGFQAAYPQYKVTYLAQGSGKAIKTAQSGAGDNSVLIVHAASLENQFVAGGYSAEPAGRAVFWGDYVLVGPANDPAGVLSGATHDVVTALEKIAAAGAAGTAQFVSRNDASGTNVQEHVLWGLTNTVSVCTVSSANGGGAEPSSSTGPCPATSIPTPAWYVLHSSAQADNVLFTDASAGSGAYTLTDRGTYANLLAQNKLANIKIVTRDNDAAARGGNLSLVNTFHAYAVNPAAAPAGTNINSAGATDFLNWLTSPAGQTAVGNYLNTNGDAPFLPSAAPTVTASALPTAVDAGKSFTVAGKISNVVPGTPALAGKTVNLQATPTSSPTTAAATVASTTTDASGNYSITYTPTVGNNYAIVTPATTQLEYPELSPQFSDLLAAGTKTLTAVSVTPKPVVKPTTKVGISKITYSKSGWETIKVRVVPTAGDATGTVTFYGRHTGNSGTKLFKLKTVKVAAGATYVSFKYNILPNKHSWKTRTWKLKVTYAGPAVLTSSSATKTLHLK